MDKKKRAAGRLSEFGHSFGGATATIREVLRHDGPRALNRYRCPGCGKRWATDADDVPEGFQDACPVCGEASWPLGRGMTARQRFTAYWILVFVAGWGFGFATGLGAGSDTWWWPLW